MNLENLKVCQPKVCFSLIFSAKIIGSRSITIAKSLPKAVHFNRLRQELVVASEGNSSVSFMHCKYPSLVPKSAVANFVFPSVTSNSNLLSCAFSPAEHQTWASVSSCLGLHLNSSVFPVKKKQ